MRRKGKNRWKLRYISLRELRHPHEMVGYTTDDGKCIYSDIEPLVKYARGNRWDVFRDEKWMRDAVIYYWWAAYDNIAVSDEIGFRKSTFDTWLWQKKRAKQVYIACRGYSDAMYRYQKEESSSQEPSG